MLVDPSNTAGGSAVTGAIRQAAQVTGTSFQYLLATAKVESGLDPQAGASTSSARGLFQFVEQTWLGTIKQSGSALGYDRYAAAITRNASGHYVVSDPSMRNEILKLRNDPTANAVMAGAFTRANAALLSQKLGRPPSEGELYVAHFLGAGGASRLISLAVSNPQASAASYFPGAAQANASIFYDRSTGAPRSFAQVRDILTARYDVAVRSRPDKPASTVAQAAPAPSSVAAASEAVHSPVIRIGLAAPGLAVQGPPVPSLAVPTVRAVRTVPISAGVVTATPAVATTAPAAVPDTAGMTSAFAEAAPKRVAQENQIFHGLFQDPGRTGPVAQVVSELWGGSNSASAAEGPAAPTSGGGGMRDLFRDAPSTRGT